MTRLRYNGLSTTLGASLTSSSTSVTFAAALTHSNGTAVPTMAGSDYIPLSILDSTGKLSEIVYLTAYTSGGTTGTITRAQEGTTGVSHASGDKVVNAPTPLDANAFHGCRAVAAAQSIANNATTALSFATEEYDTDAIHDNSTNPTRFTVPSGLAGVWRFTGTAVFASGTASSRSILWAINGAAADAADGFIRATAVSSATSGLTSSFEKQLAAGDYVEMQVIQVNGGALSVNGKASAHFLGPL